MVEVGPHTMAAGSPQPAGACETLPLCDSPQLA
jgi:hypothetical protein